jgi:hypothetical protein
MFGLISSSHLQALNQKVFMYNLQCLQKKRSRFENFEPVIYPSRRHEGVWGQEA